MSVEKSPHAFPFAGRVRASECHAALRRGCEWCVSEDHCSRCVRELEMASGDDRAAPTSRARRLN